MVAAHATGQDAYRLYRWRIERPAEKRALTQRISVDDREPAIFGERLLVDLAGRLTVVELATGAVARLDLPPTLHPEEAALAPGGSRLALSTAACVPPAEAAASLRLLRVQPRVRELPLALRLPSSGGRASLSPYAWSHDLRRLAFVLWHWGGDECRGLPGATLYVLDVATGAARTVDSGTFIYPVAFDRAARWLAYGRETNGLEDEVRLVALDSLRPRTLASGADVQADLAWSPTRPTLVYVFDDAVHAHDAETGRTRRLATTERYQVRIAGFSTDGARVAYAAVPGSTVSIVALDGGPRREIQLPQRVEAVWVRLE